jgi:hypothetical protein
MARQSDGGPAFPRPGYYPDDPNDRMEPRERAGLETDPQDGMSLRDYLAGQALAGLTPRVPVNDSSADLVAKAAYQYADAMLRARQ